MATDALRSQIASKWQESFARLNRAQPGIAGLMTFSQAWSLATDVLRPVDINAPDALNRVSSETRRGSTGKIYNMTDVRAAFALINQSRRLPALMETFLEDVQNHYHFIVRDIQDFMVQYDVNDNPDVIRNLILRLLDWYNAWAPPQELGFSASSPYTLAFQTQLFSVLSPNFAGAFKSLCASTLAAASLDAQDESTPPDASLATPRSVVLLKSVAAAIDASSLPSTSYSSIPTSSPQKSIATGSNIPSSPMLFTAFLRLGLIDRYESIIASVGFERIENHVKANYAGKWDVPVMDELRVWMAREVVPWMLIMYARGAENAEEAKSMLQGVGSRFDFHINKTLCDLRTSEIFDIIIDFPDSMGALNDLKECLQRVDQRAALVKSLRKSNRKRLLHPGADTRLILSQYVSTIRCLRIIDPPGVLLFKVADPIRRYLRERSDTIRSIVANLVGDDDTGDSLVDENEPIQPLQQHNTEDFTDPNWDPEPIDAGPEFRANKPSDVISTLVSIYDSKDLFIKELQVLLAQRLLAIKDSENEKVEKERRNIEILKIRFGEAALQVCEVMLRDMTDSKRIDGHVQSQKSSTVHPTIISRHFWPTLESSSLVMPGQFKKLQADYSREFTVFKPDKKLSWLPQLGTVEVELQLEDRIVQTNVPPLEAAFIELFSQKDVWSLAELMSGVSISDKSAALKALLTWVDLGVLKEDEENTFRLLETEEEAGPSIARDPAVLGDAPVGMQPMSSIQQQQAEQMRVYWKFIEGMLTNLGSLPLDRIQTMLKFAPGYDQTIDQLAGFMEAARREGLVIGRDGVWRLNR